MSYAVDQQRAFLWEGVDDNHGHIILNVNEKNYEMRTGEQTIESKNQVGTGCFKPIDIGRDIFDLRDPDPKQDSWPKRLFKIPGGGMADAAIDDAIEHAALQQAVKVWLSRLSFTTSILGHLLEGFNAYTTVERTTLAFQIQGYLNTPEADAEIKSSVGSLESDLRELDVNLRKAISDEEAREKKAEQSLGGAPGTQQKKEQLLKRQRWLHGRPECFIGSH
jgi:hypothetical protein